MVLVIAGLAIGLLLSVALTRLLLSSLVELGLILFFVTFIVNGIARLLVWKVGRTA